MVQTNTPADEPAIRSLNQAAHRFLALKRGAFALSENHVLSVQGS